MSETGLLIQQTIDGDKKQFNTLVRNYERLVFNYIFLMCRNKETAQDVAQETFLRAYSYLHKYDSRYAFATWLLTIAKNCYFTEIKKKGKIQIVKQGNQEMNVDFDYGEIDKNLKSSETRVDISKAIDSLQEELREVIVMKYYYDLKVKDISDILTIPEGTVKSRLFQARDELKKKLKD